MTRPAQNCDSSRGIRLLVFSVDGRAYGLLLPAVLRVVHAVEITALPNAPDVILGAINVHGRVVPVFDLRRRFRQPAREISAGDALVIAQTKRRTIALLADSVSGVIEYSDSQVVRMEDVLPGLPYVKGLVKLENGMLLIHDLDTFLSIDEEIALDHTLERHAAAG
ncbi:MAG TPA: chemotaxis protein CheW [Thermoanaerobaculia bacterium]|nr:chemotaxis protein CheW [Thermoanaerobaculia bacterium]